MTKTAVAADEPDRPSTVYTCWSVVPAGAHVVWAAPADVSVTTTATSCSLIIRGRPAR